MSAASPSQAQAGPRQSEPSSTQLWADARSAFRERRYADAALLLQQLVDGDLDASGLDAAEVRLQHGVTLLRLGRTEEGVGQLRIAVELDPVSARARHKLGAGLARLGQDAEALAQLEHATRLAPRVAEHHWRLGEQLRRLRRVKEARAAFERALELDPGYHPARDGLEALRRSHHSWLAGLARRFRRRRSVGSAQV